MLCLLWKEISAGHKTKHAVFMHICQWLSTKFGHHILLTFGLYHPAVACIEQLSNWLNIISCMSYLHAWSTSKLFFSRALLYTWADAQFNLDLFRDAKIPKHWPCTALHHYLLLNTDICGFIYFSFQLKWVCHWEFMLTRIPAYAYIIDMYANY